MPLVFVHGIGNRPGAEFEEKRRERDQLFRKFLFPVIGGQQHEGIASPIWGAHGASLRWKGASLPRGRREALGVDGGEESVSAEAAATESFETGERLLLAMASRDLADVVDLLFSVAPSEDDDGGEATAVAAAAEQMAALRLPKTSSMLVGTASGS